MKLGKLAPRYDHRTLQLTHYLGHDMPLPPASVDWRGGIPSWGMLGNDVAGDCTFAACGHLIKSWEKEAQGKIANIPDKTVLDAYSALTGYNPLDPSTDKGAVLLDVLKWWQKNTLAGYRLGAFAEVNYADLFEMKTAMWLFGGLVLGLALPLIAQDQFNAGYPWDSRIWAPGNAAERGSWGLHAVNLVAYDTTGVICITWGRQQRATWGFLYRYADEAWACLSPEWLTASGKSPSGFDLDQLQSDLAELR